MLAVSRLCLKLLTERLLGWPRLSCDPSVRCCLSNRQFRLPSCSSIELSEKPLRDCNPLMERFSDFCLPGETIKSLRPIMSVSPSATG